MPSKIPNSLKVLEGTQLSAVVFVQDYVQLQFDGPRLTAITQPRVHVINQCFEWGTQGYRDALCGRIGKLVRHAAMIPAQEIKIEFEDGSAISISLNPKDYRAAEAAIFDNPPNPAVVWE